MEEPCGMSVSSVLILFSLIEFLKSAVMADFLCDKSWSVSNWSMFRLKLSSSASNLHPYVYQKTVELKTSHILFHFPVKFQIPHRRSPIYQGW